MKPSKKSRFLPEDVKRADKLFHCLYTCTKRIQDVKTAVEMEYWEEEYYRCTTELKSLMRAKEEHDKLENLAKILRRRGVRVEVVTRIHMMPLDSSKAL